MGNTDRIGTITPPIVAVTSDRRAALVLDMVEDAAACAEPWDLTDGPRRWPDHTGHVLTAPDRVDEHRCTTLEGSAVVARDDLRGILVTSLSASGPQ